MPTTPPSGLGPCLTCRYWDTRGQPTEPTKLGDCRVDAPTRDTVTGKAVWPTCDETDWCKRWETA